MSRILQDIPVGREEEDGSQQKKKIIFVSGELRHAYIS